MASESPTGAHAPVDRLNAAAEQPHSRWLTRMPSVGLATLATVAVVYAVAYIGSAWVVRTFAPPGGFSPWYPPAGLMMALLVLAGPRWLVWAVPVRVATIALVSPSIWSRDPAAVIGRALIIVACYAGAAALLRAMRVDKAHTREFVWFTATAVVAAPLAAAVGLALLDAEIDHTNVVDELVSARVFWLGDALAIATIVPLALLVGFAFRFGRPRPHLPSSRAGRAEAAIAAAVIFLVPLAVVGGLGRQRSPSLLLLAVLPLLWVALRQDLIVAAAGIFATNAVSAFALRAALSDGELVQMQTVLLTGALAALYAGAVRRTHEDVVAELIERERRFTRLVEHAPIHVTELANDGSPRPGASPQAASSRRDRLVRDRWHLFGPGVVSSGAATTFEWSASLDGRTEWFVSSAAPLHRADGELDGVLVMTTDRTALQQARQRLANEARRDELTALLNRAGLLEALDRRRSSRHRRDHSDNGDSSDGHEEVPIAIAAVILDSADMLSVALDDTTADRVMLEVATRLARVDGCDELARIGPRSFALASVGPPGEHVQLSASIMSIATDMLDALRHGITVGSETHAVAATVGTATGTAMASELLRRAELAAHAGQAAGGDRVVEHSQQIEQTNRTLRSRVADLREAADHDDFEPWFQPIVRLSDRVQVGAEALARWRHAQRGIVTPDEFIDLGERTGLIDRIDLAVLERTVATVSRWERSGRLPPDFFVSVNVSQSHLDAPAFVERLEEIASEINPARLRLEITETAAMRDPDQTSRALERIRELGFAVILDDFGTGYSSMAWLHRLPAKLLKIDRSFIEGLPGDKDSRRIVELIAALAADLSMTVTAEGVETEAQAAILTSLGCEYGQGFLFGRPVPAHALDLK